MRVSPCETDPTLFVTPVVYTYMDSFQSWSAHRLGRARSR